MQLNKLGTVFSKSVAFPNPDEKVLYKVREASYATRRSIKSCMQVLTPRQFVADGKWRTDPIHKTEKDADGNLNNVLYPGDIIPHHEATGLTSLHKSRSSASDAAGTGMITSVAPGAS